MRTIFLLIALLFANAFSQEFVEPKKDPNENNPYYFRPYPNVLDIFQTIGVKHYTGFNSSIYRDYKITKKTLPQGVQEEYLLETTAFYGAKFLYKYLYASIDMGYIGTSRNYYASSLIQNISVQKKGFTMNTEVGARFMFLSLIAGYNFTSYTPSLDERNYQNTVYLNNPYIKFLSSLKWGPLPVWSILDYAAGFYTKDIKRTIHTLDFGIQWAITYYIDVLLSYEPLFVNYVSHNLRLQFTFQIIRELSMTFFFKNTTFSDGLPVSNQFYIGMNYFLRVEL